jgi:3-hydroxy-9,10-secoandrosta-1,3,5(10)-triene-9,17-dione monooxygenase reductase component
VSSGLEPGEFRAALGHFASGVTLVTGMHDGHPAGLTCQSFFSLSLDPPLVAFAPSKSSTSWPRVSSTGSVCINFLAADQEALALTFSQTGADKFAGVGWTPAGNGAPRLHGALAWLDCSIQNVHEEGDHWLVTAQVETVETGAGEPLLFYRGGFGGFKP